MVAAAVNGLVDIFTAAGCRGLLCATDLTGGRSVELDADEPVAAASVVKLGIAVEFWRQVAAGGIDPTGRVRVRPPQSTPGPTGLSNFQDGAELSLRDLVRMMLVISDTAATDIVLARVGLPAVNATMRALGLRDTVLAGSIRQIIDTIGQDLGFADYAAFRSAAESSPPEVVAALRQRLPEVSAMWAVGFPFEVSVAAKSGGLMGVIRNEVGVVSYPDGGRYAVAVFTRADRPFDREHDIDQAIGAAAARAVRELRAHV